MSETDCLDRQEAARPSVTFPLTTLTRRAFDFRQKLHKSWNGYMACKKNKKQTRGTEIIREFMEKRRGEFLCHYGERMRREKYKRKMLCKKIEESYQVDVKNLDVCLEISKKIVGRKREISEKKRLQEERIRNIVDKFVREQKRKEQIEEQKNKTYDYKVKPRKKTEMAPVEEEKEEEGDDEEDDDESFYEPQLEEKEKEEQEEEWVDIVKSPKKSPREPKKLEKPPQLDKKSKKEKKTNEESFVLPEVPVTNPREKIIEEGPLPMGVNLEDFKNCKNLLRVHKEVREQIEQSFPQENGIDWKPEVVIFNNFDLGGTYRTKVTFTNNSTDSKVFYFHEITLDNPLRQKVVEVEPFGVQKIIPGLSFTFYVAFSPEIDFTDLKAVLIFHTRKPENSELRQFEIPLECSLPKSDVVIRPEFVMFKNVRLWNLGRSMCSVIQFENVGTNPSVVTIEKTPIEIIEESFSVLSSSAGPDETSAECIRNVLETCHENIYNIFHFERNSFQLSAGEKILLKIHLKNASEIGIYNEKYLVKISENLYGNWVEVDSKSIYIQVEIEGHFLSLDEESIDYKICVVDSVYQELVTVRNTESFPVTVGFQVPKGLKEYFSIFPPTGVIRAKEAMEFGVKFIPRSEIFSDTKHFLPETNILHFPIKITPINKPTPPLHLDVFAILTRPRVTVKPAPATTYFQEDGETIIDLGQISTHETVLFDFLLENPTLVRQEYGFLNLPEYLTVEGDFGTLEVGERRILTGMVCPSIWDAPTKFGISSGGMSGEIIGRICCTTVSQMGGAKRKETVKYLGKKVGRSVKSTPTEMSIKTEIINEDSDDEDFYNLEETIQETSPASPTNSLKIRFEILDNWCEISRQFINFEDTPIGSFSIIHTYFNAFNNSSINECNCGYLKSNKPKRWDCHFEIFGGTDEMRIEPTCGDVGNGDSRKITLVARPKVDQKVVEERAELYKIIRMEMLKNLKRKEEKNGKEKDLRSVYRNVPVESVDLYPAEKDLWKTVQPHAMDVKFVVAVTFPKLLEKRPEYLYIETRCRVVRPLFLLNTETQLVDFGPVAVGSRPKKILLLENITDSSIAPKISQVNPSGPLLCDVLPGTVLDREHLMKIPITLIPTREESYQQHLEIVCGNTVAQFMVKGEGVQPDVAINPPFQVARVDSKFGGKIECKFTVVNKCKAPVIVYFKKIFELKGQVVPAPKPEEGPEEMAKKGKKSPGPKSPRKPPQSKKFSMDLTPDEEYSILNVFNVSDEESKFAVTVGENDRVLAGAFGKTAVKIKFETPKHEDEAKTEKKKKGGKVDDEKISKISKSSKQKDDPLLYVAKYNVYLEETVLLADFFVIGKFK